MAPIGHNGGPALDDEDNGATSERTVAAPKHPQQLLFSIPETRQILGGIAHSTIYALVKAGDLRLTKVRGRSFITAAEIERFVQEASRVAAA